MLIFDFNFFYPIIRWGPEAANYGDGNQLHWRRPQDFDASDVVVVHGKAAATAWEGDPDAPLRHGALCLVDPNATVNHTLPLLAAGDAAAGAPVSPRPRPTSRPKRASDYSGGAEEATPESFWPFTAAKKALATPRRLVARFTAAQEPSGLRSRLPATQTAQPQGLPRPLREQPASENVCTLM